MKVQLTRIKLAEVGYPTTRLTAIFGTSDMCWREVVSQAFTAAGGCLVHATGAGWLKLSDVSDKVGGLGNVPIADSIALTPGQWPPVS